jgi:hypothetical protein
VQPTHTLAEAAARNVDLIVLAAKLPSFWSGLFAPLVPQVVERVVREAPCRVFRASARDRFNCEDVWGRAGSRMDRVSGCRDAIVALALIPKQDCAAA